MPLLNLAQLNDMKQNLVKNFIKKYYLNSGRKLKYLTHKSFIDYVRDHFFIIIGY